MGQCRVFVCEWGKVVRSKFKSDVKDFLSNYREKRTQQEELCVPCFKRSSHDIHYQRAPLGHFHSYFVSNFNLLLLSDSSSSIFSY